MRNKILAFLALTLLLVTMLPLTAFAEDGYQAKIEDGANLFTDSQETELMNQLEELIGYGNMGIATNESFNSDASALARSKYIEMFGETDGLLFLIDM